jgi:hypothetical protein
MALVGAAQLAADLSAAAQKTDTLPIWDNFENSCIRPKFAFHFYGWNWHAETGEYRFPYRACTLFAVNVSG